MVLRRPLEHIADSGGAFITRGVSVDSLDRTEEMGDAYHCELGDMVQGGYYCGSAGDACDRA